MGIPLRGLNGRSATKTYRVKCSRTAETNLACRKSEVDGDTGLSGDGLAVHRIRLVSPLLHGVDSRVGEQRISGDDLNVPHAAIAKNLDVEHDGPLNLFLARQFGVLRLDLVNEPVRCGIGQSGGGSTRLGRRYAINHFAVFSDGQATGSGFCRIR